MFAMQIGEFMLTFRWRIMKYVSKSRLLSLWLDGLQLNAEYISSKELCKAKADKSPHCCQMAETSAKDGAKIR